MVSLDQEPSPGHAEPFFGLSWLRAQYGLIRRLSCFEHSPRQMDTVPQASASCWRWLEAAPSSLPFTAFCSLAGPSTSTFALLVGVILR